jgi:hypothetical protein
MMLRIIRTAFVLSLLTIFIAGSTGLSFFIHTCGSSHKTDVYVYREILNPKMSCCCDETHTGKVVKDPSVNFKDDNCCRISHLFLKAPFAGFPILEKISLKSFPVADLDACLLFQTQPTRDTEISYITTPDHSPPPLYGITLICFIHQIRIPAPAC